MANEFKVRKGLIVQGSGSNILDVQGSQGQLFSVTDSLSGSLFSVNDISGIPIMEVFSDNTIKMGTFNQEAIIISGSRTGMGTTSPQGPLHIRGTSVGSPASTPAIFLDSTGTGDDEPVDIRLASGSARGIRIIASSSLSGIPGGAAIQFYSNNASNFGGQFYIDTGTTGSSAIIFRTANTAVSVTERMRITGGGNVGIGTTNPSNTLQVSGSLWTTTITASSLPNSTQPNIIGYDTASGRLTYMPTSSFSATLTQNLTANQTVGGVSSGTTFTTGQTLENVLRTMLITFIPASISSLSVKNGGSTVSLSSRDVNQSFTINTASFSATADNPNNRFPISASITSSNAVTSFDHYLSDTLTATNAFGLGSSRTINRTTNGTVTFTIRALRPDNFSIIDTQASVSFLYRNYMAASSVTVTDNTTAQQVIDASVTNQLASSRVWNTTCTSANQNVNNFTYIIYFADYGDLSAINQGVQPVLTAFTKIGDFTITTPTYGANVLMRFYKSNAAGAFQNNQAISIS